MISVLHWSDNPTSAQIFQTYEQEILCQGFGPMQWSIPDMKGNPYDWLHRATTGRERATVSSTELVELSLARDS